VQVRTQPPRPCEANAEEHPNACAHPGAARHARLLTRLIKMNIASAEKPRHALAMACEYQAILKTSSR
jgi:hypothetical protein